ncbi:MAG: KUP/HAK/KT family potassium transporter, partial [Candidatus Caenarcaniphilales bacterium]|nr:KUP/HAK/KT family potassium transporter [Candidatus Caenarcaniphilales bacterium]
MSELNNLQKASIPGLLVALGIVFGDIGTSPLYVLRPVMADKPVSELLVLGALSCIFWTLTMQTTIKYIFLTLKADNKGEGGIFALYALLRHKEGKWLIFPAMLGGSMLLADGVITPPISVASAIEGLSIIYPNIQTLPIVIGILLGLFLAQPFGTEKIGKFFGPVMLVWFTTIGIVGLASLIGNLGIIRAINPFYAFKFLSQYPNGIWLLGAIFLCSTGAEALYSDLGHCGRQNIRFSWSFVKLALILNYFGQGAWLLKHIGQTYSSNFNPFYSIMPNWFLSFGIGIATLATIIASQALISGSYTLVNEAMRLNLWPKLEVDYPSEQRGQIYVPWINWFLCICCIGVTLFFRESKNMEAAFGLAVTLTMLMTTVLFAAYLDSRRTPKPLIKLYLTVYLLIESSFLVANLVKFFHGGWVTLLIGGSLFYVMWTWYQARFIYRKYVQFQDVKEAIPC